MSDLFSLEYGHSLELNKLEKSSAADAVNFVGRAARNNGVTARVKRVRGVEPAPAGTITVALNGQGGAGVAFLQPAPYYTAFHVMVLTPKRSMTDQEKLWWAACITANRFRFGFGRQANRTLKDIELPNPKQVPNWVQSVDLESFFSATFEQLRSLAGKSHSSGPTSIGTERQRVGDLFDVQLGTNLELLRLTRQDDGINFVSRTARNNGVSARVAPVPGLEPTQGGVLSVAGGGSVLQTFVQFEPFYSGRDLFVLIPKSSMTPEQLMFYAACLRENQWRYSYGRQANRTLKDLQIPALDSIPTWVSGSFIRVVEQLAGR